MIKQEKARSVYVMVSYDKGPYFASLLEVKLDGKKQQSLPLLKPAARFKEKELSIPVLWKFCTSGSGSSTNLYLLPDSGPDQVWNANLPSLKGYIFDAKTRQLVSSIKPPKAPKWFGPAVTAYGKIYFFVDPYCSPEVLDPSFERYDPNTDSWEGLKPFPYTEGWGKTEVVGCAICDGFILFNIGGRSGQCALWAYDVRGNEWHRVKVKDRECYYFQGQAVVANETIYALSISSYVSVMAFSITREQAGECFVVTCSVDSLFKSPDMVGKFPPRADWKSELLVHLCNLEFCLVQTGFCDGRDDPFQFLLITTFQLVGKSEIKITYSQQYMVPLDCLRTFRVSFGFSPDCDDIEQKEDIASDCDDIEQQEDERDIEFILDCEYIVPAKEEEIGTLVDQPKQKEETMGNVSSCLTGDFEDMEPEECELATPSNQPEKEENIGNVNFCLTPMTTFARTTQNCNACEKTVYLVDHLVVNNKVYHKACFRCNYATTAKEPPRSVLKFPVCLLGLENQDKCVACKKTVYAIKKVGIDGTLYHKACFRCTHGGCVINPPNFVAHEHCLYYRHHHNQLFKQKGNFSELDKDEEAKGVTENAVTK